MNDDASEPGSASVSLWFSDLQEGDPRAADKLWDRYFHRLVALARTRLGETPRRVADEEDVAVSVFQSLCQRAEGGQFDQVRDRDDLWRLIATITARKVIDQQRADLAQKRGGGKVRGESIVARAGALDSMTDPGMDMFSGDEPTPAFLTQLAEEYEVLLEQLGDETLRKVACWKMEGLENDEIAEELGRSERSVRRKLEIIRAEWETLIQ